MEGDQAMKYLLIVIAALLAMIGVNAAVIAAHAADLSTPAVKAIAVATTPAFKWQDCYLAMIGGGVTGSNQTGSATAGALVGCNYQTGAIVYGFEGEATAAQSSAGAAPQTVNIAALATLALRVGYAWHGTASFGPVTVNDALIYAKADLPGNVLTAPGPTNLQGGWGFGGGLEYLIRTNVASRLEYDFQDVNGMHSHVFKQMLVLYY